MRFLVAVAAACALAACAPPSVETTESTAPATTPEVAAPDLGPFSNTWDSEEFSRFRHTLHAAVPGRHTIALAATTTSPGGETVAIYPVGEDGVASTARIMFVVASVRGETGSTTVEIPEGGLPVEVVVENASHRRFSGSYTITVTPEP
jgi:hypothetical protein